MRLPSLQAVLTTAGGVLRRFPLTLFWAFVLEAVGVYMMHLSNSGVRDEKLTWQVPLLSTAALGLSGTLALALMAERYRWSAAVRWGAQAVGVGLLLLWYLAAPAHITETWVLRLFLLGLGLHLLVAAGPYLSELRRTADTPGFWRYNETLFLRFLLSGLYSGVLFVGCALALTAIHQLFDVKVPGVWFGYLFCTLGTVFNTWFFLAGVPADFAALEHETSYPKGLKLFTQFVLLPLVVLYLAILYAYLGRILLSWSLPKGWVSMLVLALAVAGIFALLLIHPIRQAAENTWIRSFARWFYLALFPLLGLLAVAIGTRVRAYGITEERYFVLVLAGWLLVLAVYFLWRRGQGIIWIPASLAVVVFLAAGGPWGAFAVARRSQLHRLQAIATQYGLWQNGRLDDAGTRVPKLPYAARKQLWDALNFFKERRALADLQPYFRARIIPPDSIARTNRWAYSSWVESRLAEELSIPETGDSEESRWQTTHFRTDETDLINLGSGRYFISEVGVMHYLRQTEGAIREVDVAEGQFRFWASHWGGQLELQQKQAGRWQPLLTLPPSQLADSLARRTGVVTNDANVLPPATLTTQARQGRYHVQLHFSYLNRSFIPGTDSLTYDYQAQALLEIAPH